MKKVLAFNQAALGQMYARGAPDGGPLRCRRLEQAGRLELVRVLNDPPPYWFVLIRNFDQSPEGADRKALKGLTTPWGNGVWRFQIFEEAKAKFEKLSRLPIFVAEQAKAQKQREEKIQLIKKVGTPYPGKSNPPIAGNLPEKQMSGGQ